MGLEPVLTRAAFRLNDRKQALRIGYYGAGPNRQFDYDHRNDLTLVLDKDNNYRSWLKGCPRLTEEELNAVENKWKTFVDEIATLGKEMENKNTTL